MSFSLGEVKVLITGGAGFLGSAIIRAFQNQCPEYSLAVLDLLPPDAWDSVAKAAITADLSATSPPPLQPLAPVSSSTGASHSTAEISYYQADITSRDDVLAVFQAAKPTLVVHTAGVVPRGAARYIQRDREAVFRINVGGTQNVLDAMKKCGTPYLVYTSSTCVITDDIEHDYPNVNETFPTGNATLIYGQSKAAAEALVLEANDPPRLFTTALRPSTIIGPNPPPTTIIPPLYRMIARGETPFVIGNGENLYDFLCLPNAADAHVLAARNLLLASGGGGNTPTAAGEAFFISNGEPIRFRHFCLAVWKEFGHIPPFTITVPRGLAWFAGLLVECAGWAFGSGNGIDGMALSRGSAKDACGHSYADITKATRVLGYKPRVGLGEGVKLYCADYLRTMQKEAKESK